MELKKNYISTVSAQSLGRVCTMGANFAVFILAARLLGAELFGQYSYVTIFLGLAIMVAEFGTTSVLAADVGNVGAEISVYWGNFLFLRLIITLCVTALAIPIAWMVRPDLFSSLVMGLVGLVFLGSRFFDPLFQVFERPWYSFWSSVVYSLVFAVLSITVLLTRRSIFELIAVYVLANCLYTLVAARQSISLVRPSFKLQWRIQKSILSLAIPIGVSGIFTLVHTRADTFMLAVMKGDYAVGIYNGAYRFLDMGVIAAVMLSTPLVSILSKIALVDREAMRRHYGRILEVLTAGIVPFAIMVPLLSGICVATLFGAEYAEVEPLLNIMAWIGVLTFFSMFNFVALLAVKVVRFQVWLGAVTALMNVLLNYLFIPRFSFYGSAWATLFVECVFVFVSFVYIIKSIGNFFRYQIWWRIGLVSVLVFAAVYFTPSLSLSLRLLVVLTVWLGAQMILKIPLWRFLSR